MIHRFSLLFCFGKVLAPHNTVWETCFLLNKIKCSLSDVLSHVKIPFPLTEIKRKRRKDTFSLVSCEPESVLLFSFIFLFSFFIILFLLFSLNAINYSPRCFFAEQNVVQVYNQYLLIAKTQKKIYLDFSQILNFILLYDGWTAHVQLLWPTRGIATFRPLLVSFVCTGAFLVLFLNIMSCIPLTQLLFQIMILFDEAFHCSCEGLDWSLQDSGLWFVSLNVIVGRH